MTRLGLGLSECGSNRPKCGPDSARFGRVWAKAGRRWCLSIDSGAMSTEPDPVRQIWSLSIRMTLEPESPKLGRCRPPNLARNAPRCGGLAQCFPEMAPGEATKIWHLFSSSGVHESCNTHSTGTVQMKYRHFAGSAPARTLLLWKTKEPLFRLVSHRSIVELSTISSRYRLSSVECAA